MPGYRTGMLKPITSGAIPERKAHFHSRFVLWPKIAPPQSPCASMSIYSEFRETRFPEIVNYAPEPGNGNTYISNLPHRTGNRGRSISSPASEALQGLEYRNQGRRRPRTSPRGQCKCADYHVGQPQVGERIDNLKKAVLKNGRAIAALWHDEFSWSV